MDFSSINFTNMAHLIATTWTLLFCCLCFDRSTAEDRIELSAPVNPVDESGILSILCQVWDLGPGEEVSIFRRAHGSTVGERLTLGDGVATNVDSIGDLYERIFLATRKPMDGSTMFFLSIMDAVRTDAGEYSCRVTGTGADFSIYEIASKTISINLNYFPSETNPMCSTLSDIPSIGYQLTPGNELVIRCSSEKGNPVISIKWNNTANTYIDPKDIRYGETDDQVFSELTLRSPSRHVKPVFICIISSPLFQGRTKTCTVGPIDMLADPSAKPSTSGSQGTGISFPHPGPPTRTSGSATLPKTPQKPVEPGESHTCRQQCDAWNESTFYWIISAVVTFIFAIVLFITCVTLFVRYNRLPSYQNPKCIVRPRPRDDIYTELDCRLNDNKLYLAVEKRDNKDAPKIINSDFEEFHYVAPNAPTMQMQA